MSAVGATRDGEGTLDLVVLVSGSGTNLQSILDAIESRRLDGRVRLVVSNRDGVQALERARRASVRTVVLSHKAYDSRDAYDRALVDEVSAAFDACGSARRWVVLAGFMRILTPRFLDAFSGRVLNIHPSLLPAFPGIHAQKQALDYGVRVAGCTVHLVDHGTDTGRILAQAAVPVLEGDDEATLGARILEQEHALLPAVLRWISEGQLSIVDGVPRYRSVVPALGLSSGREAAR